MDNYNNIEDLLKGTFEGYEKQPSPKVWNAISKKLFFSSTLFYGLIIFFLIITGLGIYFYDNTNNVETAHKQTETGRNQESTSPVLISNDQEDIFQQKTTVNTPGSDEPVLTKKEEMDNGNGDKHLSSNTVKEGNIKEEEDTPKSNTVTHRDNKVSTIKTPVTQKYTASVSAAVTFPGVHSISGSQNDYSLTRDNVDNTVSVPATGFGGTDFRMQFYTFNTLKFDNSYLPKAIYAPMPKMIPVNYRSLYGGIFIMPEMIFNTDEDNSIKKAVDIDVLIKYGDDYFIEGGLGVSLSQDDGRYDIRYSQYDSVGYYYEVNSFAVDPTTGEPVFKTTLESLYDTVDYKAEELKTNSYTYMRLPVMLGMNLRTYDKFGISLKAGVVYTVLIHSREPEANYKNENAMSILINDVSPVRFKSIFQLSASVGFSYNISDKFSLSLDPVFGYYMRPLYEQRMNSGKKPWSAGLRFGFYYKIK